MLHSFQWEMTTKRWRVCLGTLCVMFTYKGDLRSGHHVRNCGRPCLMMLRQVESLSYQPQVGALQDERVRCRPLARAWRLTTYRR